MKPLIIALDAKANRNIEAVLTFYDEMLNKKQATGYEKVCDA